MADNNDNNNNNNEDKQRKKLEAKREYNRILSAHKRQQIKKEIATLTAQAEFHSDHANKLEKKNVELLQQIQVLTVANQRLRERIQQLTSSIATTSTAAQNSSIGGGGEHRPELTAAATIGNTTAGGCPPPLPPLLSTFDPRRYNRHLTPANFLSDARSSSSGGDAGCDPMLGSRWAAASPHWRVGQLRMLDQQLLTAPSFLFQQRNDTNNSLAAAIQQHPFTQQELLGLWIHRLNSSTPRNNNNTIPLASNSIFMMRGPPPRDDGSSNVVAAVSEIPVVSGVATATASTAGDASSLLARRLVATAEVEQGSGGGPSSTTSK